MNKIIEIINPTKPHTASIGIEINTFSSKIKCNNKEKDKPANKARIMINPITKSNLLLLVGILPTVSPVLALTAT